MFKIKFYTIIAFVCICKISVADQCGNNVTASSGSILSPNYPSNYAPNTDCSSLITTPENTVISLEIVDMKTESSFDKVTIYDGPSTSDDELALYSGTVSKVFLNASSNQVLIHFISDSSNNYKGFNITFTSDEICGGNFTGSSGSIHSPNYPENYGDNLDCGYLLSTPEDTALTLEIVALDLESNGDFIEIYDGPTEDYRLLGTFRGNSSDGVQLYASTNVAYVHFYTDDSGEGTGFDIKFTETEKCGQDVSGTYGAIISQGYPVQPYPNDQNCYYKVTTSEDTAVTIDIIDLGLEENDYVEIFDGPTTSSASLGQYTGEQTDVQIFATTNVALIYFHTDNSGQGRGFYIYFQEREIDHSCPAGSYSDDFGVISSPFYPSNYPDSTDCFYSIATSENTQITLHTNFLQVEESSNCSKDFVEIFDGPTTSNSLAKLCGSGPINDIISSSNEMFIHFHSDNETNGEGFNITYNTNPCPDQSYFDNDFGTIYSPGFPLYNYPNNANCIYSIATPYGSQAHITVVYLNLESTTNCSSDNIRIYDGSTQDDTLLDELCGSSSMLEFQASSNEVLIEFNSDNSINNKGFVISYVSTYYYGDDSESLHLELDELIKLIE